MNEHFKKQVIDKTICYYKKNKKETCYTFIFDNRFGVMFRKKGKSGSLLISSEKAHLVAPRNMKKTDLNDGVVKLCKLFKQSYKFPPETLAFATAMVETITEEIKKIKPQNIPPINCNGG